jgi:hypothetical protein
MTREVPIDPPAESKYGWQVRIWVPPQAPKNGDSTGPQLRVFIPEGELIE